MPDIFSSYEMQSSTSPELAAYEPMKHPEFHAGGKVLGLDVTRRCLYFDEHSRAWGNLLWTFPLPQAVGINGHTTRSNFKQIRGRGRRGAYPRYIVWVIARLTSSPSSCHLVMGMMISAMFINFSLRAPFCFLFPFLVATSNCLSSSLYSQSLFKSLV
jgi:hypothetical protein